MSYESLFKEIRQVADSYSLGKLLTGLDASLVNILLTNHWAKIEACKDYETSVAMVNHAISTHVRIRMHIDSIITDEKDRRKLYNLFQAWRQQLSNENEAQRLSVGQDERCL